MLSATTMNSQRPRANMCETLPCRALSTLWAGAAALLQTTSRRPQRRSRAWSRDPVSQIATTTPWCYPGLRQCGWTRPPTLSTLGSGATSREAGGLRGSWRRVITMWEAVFLENNSILSDVLFSDQVFSSSSLDRSWYCFEAGSEWGSGLGSEHGRGNVGRWGGHDQVLQPHCLGPGDLHCPTLYRFIRL